MAFEECPARLWPVVASYGGATVSVSVIRPESREAGAAPQQAPVVNALTRNTWHVVTASVDCVGGKLEVCGCEAGGVGGVKRKG